MDERKDAPGERNEGPQTGSARRPYTTPKLIEYGSVTQLTAGSLSRQSDAPFSGFKKA